MLGSTDSWTFHPQPRLIPETHLFAFLYGCSEALHILFLLPVFPDESDILDGCCSPVQVKETE